MRKKASMTIETNANFMMTMPCNNLRPSMLYYKQNISFKQPGDNNKRI
uniref:Uncharacterized protein n=1 Tax=Arundo donax TaxID=35708 RepID=A0A0A9FCP0_ARUDO